MVYQDSHQFNLSTILRYKVLLSILLIGLTTRCINQIQYRPNWESLDSRPTPGMVRSCQIWKFYTLGRCNLVLHPLIYGPYPVASWFVPFGLTTKPWLNPNSPLFEEELPVVLPPPPWFGLDIFTD